MPNTLIASPTLSTDISASHTKVAMTQLAKEVHRRPSQIPRSPRKWREIAEILSSAPRIYHGRESNKKGSGGLRIKLLDTVFVEAARAPPGVGVGDSNSYAYPPPYLPRIVDWVFTSRSGEASRRKNVASLDWNHVRDRFGRFALANMANARGPRIVAVGREGSGGDIRFHLTAEQFDCEVKGGGGGRGGGRSILSKCEAIQCYLRPLQGKDQTFRAVYGFIGDNNSPDVTKGEPYVNVYIAEDGVTGSDAEVFQWEGASGNMRDEATKKEIELSVGAIVSHIEKALKPAPEDQNHNPAEECEGQNKPLKEKLRVTSLSAEFILDDNRHLWLCNVSNVITNDMTGLQTEKMMRTNIKKTGSNGIATIGCPEALSQKKEPAAVPHGDEIHNSPERPKHKNNQYIRQNTGDPQLTTVTQGSETCISEEGHISSTLSTDCTSECGPQHKMLIEHKMSAAETEYMLHKGIEKIQCRSGDMNPSHSKEAIASLRGLISRLEEEVRNEKKRFSNSSQVASATKKRVQDLLKELSLVKKRAARDKQRKEAQYEHDILDLRSQQNSSKAEISRLKGCIVQLEGSMDRCGVEECSDSSKKSLYDDLLAKVNALHQELTLAQRRWGEERRALTSTHAAAEQERAAEHRSQLAEHRTIITALEDEETALQDDKRDIEKEKIVLLQKLTETEQKRETLSKECDQVRRELELMRQGLEMEQRINTNGKESRKENGKDRTTTQATTDARVRTLNNKIEYLMAQLASEATVKEEYTAAIANIREEKEALVIAHRTRLTEIEARQDQQIVQIQDQLRMSVEKPMHEISELHTRIADLQAQLANAMQEVTEARKREEVARADVLKEQAHLNISKEELRELRKECVEAHKQVEKLKDASIDAVVNEGMFRRLENEQQYLKNQLQNEMTCKAELLGKCEKTQRDLEEAKTTIKAESDTFAVTLKSKEDKHDSITTELKGSNQVLEAEVEVQRGQLDQIRDAYSKKRDQFRLAQASGEQIRAAGQRMAEELKGAQEELVYTRKLNDSAQARHSTNIKVISEGIKKSDDVRVQEINKMQQDMHQALQETSTTQREMLQLRGVILAEQVISTKRMGAQMIASACWQRLRLIVRRTFSVWTTVTLVHHIKESTKENISAVLEKNERRIRDDCEEATNSIIGKLKLVHTEHVKEVETRLVEDRRLQLNQTRIDTLKALENERESSVLLLQEKEASCGKKEKEMRSAHQSEIARMGRENNKALEMVKTRSQKRVEAAAKEADASLRERQEIIIKDCNERWEAKVRNLEADFVGVRNEAIAEAKREGEKEISSLREVIAADRGKLGKEKAKEIADAVKEETVRMEAILTCALSGYESKWRNRVYEAEEKCKQEALAAGKINKNKIESVTAEINAMAEKKLTEQATNLERSHLAKIQLLHDKEKEQIAYAVKSEAGKCKQALREAETRMEKKYRTYAEKGAKEQEQRSKKEIEGLQKTANEALEKAKERAKESLENALNESRCQFVCAKEQAEKEKEEAIARAIDSAKAESAMLLKDSEKRRDQLLEDEKDKLKICAEEGARRAVQQAIELEKITHRKIEAELEKVTAERRKDQEAFEFQMECVKQDAENAMNKHLSEFERSAQRLRDVDKEKAGMDRNRQRKELGNSHNIELEKIARKSAEKTTSLVKRVKQEAEEAMQEASRDLALKHSNQMDYMKKETADLRDHKSAAEAKLKDKILEVKDQNLAIDHLEEALKNLQKLSSFRFLQFVSTSLSERERHRKSLHLKDKETFGKIEAAKVKGMEEKWLLEKEFNEMEKILSFYKEQQHSVHQTIFNYKRDALLQHKVKSRELSTQLDAISKQRGALEDQRNKAEIQMKKMEDGIRNLEQQLREHSQISTIQGGRINIAHARRKKRLDEEYEQLLENIESKREHTVVLDTKIKDAQGKKEEYDDKMKSVERSLVEVLVEQQKKLLSLVSTKRPGLMQ